VAIWRLKTGVDAIRIIPHTNVEFLVWKKPKFSVYSQIKNHGHVKLNTSVVKFGKFGNASLGISVWCPQIKDDRRLSKLGQ
jgi:hypothetical protein